MTCQISTAGPAWSDRNCQHRRHNTCISSPLLLGLVFLAYSLSLLVSPVRAFSSLSFAFAFLPSTSRRSTKLFLQQDRRSLDSPKYNISVLIIDHYDSFTYNLYDYFAQLLVEPPTVIAKDAFDDFQRDQWGRFDGIVLSPGPGTPHEQPPLSHQAITHNSDVPLLGVCLGHQLIALNYGANVGKAPIPIHGQDHLIMRENLQLQQVSPLFQDLPNAFRVVRYHSLAAYYLPDCLHVLARSEGDNVVQAIQHQHFPHYGVQFHPESIGTQHGMALIENFCRIVQAHKSKKTSLSTIPNIPWTISSQPKVSPSAQAPRQQPSEPRFRIVCHAFQSTADADPEAVFESLYEPLPYSIWLDSSSAAALRGDLDIIAAPSSPGDVIEYNRSNKNVSTLDILSQLEHEIFGTSLSNHDRLPRSLSKELAVISNFNDPIHFEAEDSNQSPLPFHYRGGFLGYLGYEVRHDTQQYLYHRHHTTVHKSCGIAEGSLSVNEQHSSAVSDTPTAAFFLARNSLVFHHPSRMWYMISLVEQDEDLIQTVSWMKSTKQRILDLNKELPESPKNHHIQNLNTPGKTLVQFTPSRSKEEYEAAIAQCHDLIRQGESYELCLTNQLEAHLPNALSTWELYKLLRRRNPAPYSAFFRWRQRDSMGKEMSICCSSPERFMSVQRKQLFPGASIVLQAEAKPIKGTARRVLPSNGSGRTEAEEAEDQQLARDLEFSLKNRAENLMIVDLLRNDMSRVCQVGSVHVAKLMAIESFATVHQMVSTIRGVLATGAGQEKASTCIDLLRAAFPGGSMTGAPKTRTMELLEELEQHEERGPYAGSLGYISVNGCMDMNIIIRSAVITQDGEKGQRIKIGAGGAVTALSEPKDEYDEMQLKAEAVVQAVQDWVAAHSLPYFFDSNSTLSVLTGDAR